MTHVNSFYEIPDNSLAGKLPALQGGNDIVNDISLMLFFVLSRDLQKIVWQDHIRRVESTALLSLDPVTRSRISRYHFCCSR